jgi:hypothetical protein
MNWFPQLGSGAMAQYPLQRNRQWRAITNTLESGETIRLGDVPGGWIEWRLRYEELSDAEGLLSAGGGFGDPLGSQRGWNVQNGNGAEQALSQTLSIPGEYTACFSAYVRSDSAGAVGIARDSNRVSVPVGPQWKRIQISGSAAAGATASTFSVIFSAGSTVRVFGLQVEAQPWPSIYRPTGAAAGILEETRFDGGELKVVHTAPGLSACQVSLISRV